MNLSSILQQKIKRLNYIIQIQKSKLKQLSIFRIFSFLAWIFFLILSYLYREISFLVLVPIFVFGVFIYFVRSFEQVQNFLYSLNNFKSFLERDKLRAERKLSLLHREDFQNENTHFYKDLDILGKNSLYNFLDTTVTKSGNNLFLRSILQVENPSLEQIQDRQATIQELCKKKYFSRKLLRLFNEISPNNGYTKIPFAKLHFSAYEYFQHHFLQKHFLFFLSFTYSLVVLCLVLNKIPILSALFLFQSVFAYWNFREKLKLKKNLQGFIESIKNKEKLFFYIAKQNFQSKILNKFQLEKQEVQNIFSRILKISKKSFVWNSPLIGFFLNVFFLWDFFIFRDFAKFEQEFKERFTRISENLEKIDSLLPFFVLYYHNPECEFPRISSEFQSIQAESLAHPLLDSQTRVKNPLEPISFGKGILITGSNMSGKTTYLRTIGVNTLLALCGGPTVSKGFSLPPLKILTSIRNEDSLQDGISFFYAEVKKIKYILESVENSSFPCLILIDEILKGTNTRERVIATKKILEFLQKTQSFVLVTTHDLELAFDLKDKFALKHFEEQIENEKMSFDYKIRDGLVTSSNALKLLSLEYPSIQFFDS